MCKQRFHVEIRDDDISQILEISRGDMVISHETLQITLENSRVFHHDSNRPAMTLRQRFHAETEPPL